MPPKKRVENKSLEVECKWDRCGKKFDQIDPLYHHIMEHLTEAVENAEHTCLWADCCFFFPHEVGEFRRHLYLHCFHTKLKQLGQQVLDAQEELGCCSLDSRTILPEIPANFVCHWKDCEQPPFENPEWFYRHVEMHGLSIDIAPGESELPIRCEWKGCEATTKGRPKLREHLRSHIHAKVVACPGCGTMFANNTKLLDHVTRQNAVNGQTFHCSHCSKHYTTERLLRDHMRTHVNHYKCPFCDMTCTSPSSLRNHVKFRHNNEKPYGCEYCEYSCKSTIDLRKHMITHNSEPAFHCKVPGCAFTTRALSSMKAHEKKHEGSFAALYKCHVCDKCFTRGHGLTLHLQRKHQFKWPSGHPRFRYKLHEDGFMRLQLIRYETVELAKQIMSKEAERNNTENGDHTGTGEKYTGPQPPESLQQLKGFVVETQKTPDMTSPDLTSFSVEGYQQENKVLAHPNTMTAEDFVILHLQNVEEQEFPGI